MEQQNNVDRVMAHTSDRVLEKIDRSTVREMQQTARASQSRPEEHRHELDREREALKALRGDFSGVRGRTAAERAAKALLAASR